MSRDVKPEEEDSDSNRDTADSSRAISFSSIRSNQSLSNSGNGVDNFMNVRSEIDSFLFSFRNETKIGGK
ncbi:hypothetical protein LINPERHAP2_LOCUS30495 [Linum perenne]